MMGTKELYKQVCNHLKASSQLAEAVKQTQEAMHKRFMISHVDLFIDNQASFLSQACSHLNEINRLFKDIKKRLELQ